MSGGFHLDPWVSRLWPPPAVASAPLGGTSFVRPGRPWRESSSPPFDSSCAAFFEEVAHLGQAAAQAGQLLDLLLGLSGAARRGVLWLTRLDYERWAGKVTEGLQATAKLLHSLLIYDGRDVPYHTQLTPLAAIL